MAQQKQVTVTVAGTGQTHQIDVNRGDEPDDVLWHVTDDEDGYIFRQGDNEVIDPGTDAYRTVKEGEALFAATDPVVG